MKVVSKRGRLWKNWEMKILKKKRFKKEKKKRKEQIKKV